MELKKYKFEKVATASKFWEVPTEPLYLFETGIRRAISIVPNWTTWNMKTNKEPEYIFDLDIICVYQSFEARIEAYSISVSSIEDLYHKEVKGNYGGPQSVIKFLVDLDSYGTKDEQGNDTGTMFYGQRTKEQFESDFQCCIQSMLRKGHKGLRPIAKQIRVKKQPITISMDFETGGLDDKPIITLDENFNKQLIQLAKDHDIYDGTDSREDREGK